MAGINAHTHHILAFAFGLLGNLVSFMVYLVPLPTFYRVYKKKSTEGFQSIPYVVSLFSAMLWMFYALIKTDGFLLLIINAIGCIIQSMYIIAYFIYAYAPRPAKIYTAKLLLLLNVVSYGLILLFTMLFSKSSKRVTIVGWICSVFAVCVFAAPLTIMKKVITTKSVEFMPIYLTFFLTLCAIVVLLWTSDNGFYIAAPNVLGFIFGVAQMILYYIYRHPRPDVVPEVALPQTQPNGGRQQPLIKVTNQPVQPSECNVV